MNRDEILKALKRTRYELSLQQSRIGEIMESVAALPHDAPPELVCPDCRGRWRSANAMAEHRYNSHGGPLPAHIIAAEARADTQGDESEAA